MQVPQGAYFAGEARLAGSQVASRAAGGLDGGQPAHAKVFGCEEVFAFGEVVEAGVGEKMRPTLNFIWWVYELGQNESASEGGHGVSAVRAVEK